MPRGARDRPIRWIGRPSGRRSESGGLRHWSFGHPFSSAECPSLLPLNFALSAGVRLFDPEGIRTRGVILRDLAVLHLRRLRNEVEAGDVADGVGGALERLRRGVFPRFLRDPQNFDDFDDWHDVHPLNESLILRAKTEAIPDEGP